MVASVLMTIHITAALKLFFGGSAGFSSACRRASCSSSRSLPSSASVDALDGPADMSLISMPNFSCSPATADVAGEGDLENALDDSAIFSMCNILNVYPGFRCLSGEASKLMGGS